MDQPQIYVARRHIVKSYGLVEAENVAVKFYTLFPENSNDFDSPTIDFVKGMLKRNIKGRSIDKRLGLGFSILSDKLFNVCIWGGDYPSLLNQSLYLLCKEEQGECWRKQSAEDIGSFCCWELGIVSHEAKSWRQYLLSSQSSVGREAYLTDKFQGLVD